MAGVLVRSGSLREFHALGAVGSPVFSAASQLRAAMRRQISPQVADLFAIPRPNEKGDSIDWYAPNKGDVVPWSAIATEQRIPVKNELLAARAELKERALAMQAEPSSERQVFGRLLEQATAIPSDDHVYLVNGRPVMTFWGFNPLDAPADLDVIGNLDVGLVEPGSGVPLATAAPIAAVATRTWWWWWPSWLWWLLLLLLALLLLWWLRGCGGFVPGLLPFGDRTDPVIVEEPYVDPVVPVTIPSDPHNATVVPVDPVIAGAVEEDRGEIEPVAEEDEPPSPPETLSPPEPLPPPEPEIPDESDSPEEPDEEPDEEPEEETDEPGTDPLESPIPPDIETPPGTPLVIPPGAESTDFLQGRWRSITGLQDERGNPIVLDYELENGQGTVGLKRMVGGDEQQCTGRVESKLVDGKLVFSQDGIRCPDGTGFQGSTVECVDGPDGKAKCEGINTGGSRYEVEMVK